MEVGEWLTWRSQCLVEEQFHQTSGLGKVAFLIGSECFQLFGADLMHTMKGWRGYTRTPGKRGRHSNVANNLKIIHLLLIIPFSCRHLPKGGQSKDQQLERTWVYTGIRQDEMRKFQLIKLILSGANLDVLVPTDRGRSIRDEFIQRECNETFMAAIRVADDQITRQIVWSRALHFHHQNARCSTSHGIAREADVAVEGKQ